MHDIELILLSRRQLLRYAGLTGGVVLLAPVVAACGTSASTPSPTPLATPSVAASATAAAVASPTPAPLTGKRVGIPSLLVIGVFDEFWADMKAVAALPGNGEEITVAQADGDSVKQRNLADQFIAQGVDAMLVIQVDTSGWAEIIERAKQKNVFLLNHSPSALGGASQNVGLDQQGAGFQVGKDAANWINAKHGGTAEVGLLASSGDPQLALRGVGFKAALAQYAPNAKIVGEAPSLTLAEGAASAANLLQAHPNIKVILALGDDAGLGALQAATERGKTSADEFYIGSCDGSSPVLDKIAEGGIYQSVWDFVFPTSAVASQMDIERALRGEAVKPTRVQHGFLVTKANLADAQKYAADPLAPDVLAKYPELMSYYDVELDTGELFPTES